jgi:hypothetical protein
MRRMDARRKKAKALGSQSLANLRQRFSHVSFFAFDFLAVIPIGIDASLAFFCALHVLAINDGGGRARFSVTVFGHST